MFQTLGKEKPWSLKKKILIQGIKLDMNWIGEVILGSPSYNLRDTNF